MEEMVECINNKLVAMAYHCGDKDCEQSIKDETGIQSRVIICDACNDEKCIKCGKKAKYKAYFAKQY
jgi:prolyl-tRNA synthetase